MLRISKLTDYATLILAHLADGPAGLMTAAELAAATGIGLPTVSKVLKELQHAHLVDSTRGARGGYVLARPAASISAADIIDAVEGPVGLTECATQPGACGLEGNCRVGRTWQRVNVAIRGALRAVTLMQLAGSDPTPVAVPDLAASLGAQLASRARNREAS
jgi:FeS assembly SUF system regulator